MSEYSKLLDAIYARCKQELPTIQVYSGDTAIGCRPNDVYPLANDIAKIIDDFRKSNCEILNNKAKELIYGNET